ncbi:MAG: PIN domain-containing protein [Planctomycetes bacterium]|nr:PIN domain-containing protein [Planctomycetota bacterium]
MKKLRINVDTSVFGGCFDPEFADVSRELVAEIQAGRFTLVLSTTVLRELAGAPEHVRKLLADLPAEHLERIELSEEIETLRDAYVAHGVVGPASVGDAEHIAAASVAGADVIVSWNFKHIVHYDKIRGYHAVNAMNGYPSIPIHSPQEVIRREDETV